MCLCKAYFSLEWHLGFKFFWILLPDRYKKQLKQRDISLHSKVIWLTLSDSQTQTDGFRKLSLEWFQVTEILTPAFNTWLNLLVFSAGIDQSEEGSSLSLKLCIPVKLFTFQLSDFAALENLFLSADLFLSACLHAWGRYKLKLPEQSLSHCLAWNQNEKSPDLWVTQAGVT